MPCAANRNSAEHAVAILLAAIAGSQMGAPGDEVDSNRRGGNPHAAGFGESLMRLQSTKESDSRGEKRDFVGGDPPQPVNTLQREDFP